MLPTSQGMADFKFSDMDFKSSDKKDWKPPVGRRALYGMWLAEGGDCVLEIDPRRR